MKLRVLSMFFLLVLGSSCQFFNPDKNNPLQKIDTVIDYSSVDTFPAFDNCKKSIDKDEQILCFRTTIHRHITSTLSKQKFKLKKSFNDTFVVHVLVNNKGVISLKKIESTPLIRILFPSIDSIINESIRGLPKTFPAIKRGIPVATQYQIPIQISVK